MSVSHESLRPVKVDRPATAADDPRVGTLFAQRLNDSTRLVIVGFPVDEGVRRNGGRPGAAEAPAAIRHWLHRMTPDPRDDGRMAALLARTIDLGDVAAGGDLEQGQARLGEAIAPHLEAGRTVIVLGGGHETAFGVFLGHVAAGRRSFIVNLDAHADVRPLREIDGVPRGHSGSPFRQAIEHASAACAGYAVAGLQATAVAAAHHDWMRSRGATPSFIDELPRDADGRLDPLAAMPPWKSPADDRHASIMATLDLDAVEACSAPGVSAPTPAGLPVDSWLAAAERLGADPRVASLDLVELSPPHDPEGRTARLAALTVWRFLRGWSGRA
ncbi:MAG: formimidoylglutamase [Phycisphaerales bacterium]